jgi:hypothetical protein
MRSKATSLLIVASCFVLVATVACESDGSPRDVPSRSDVVEPLGEWHLEASGEAADATWQLFSADGTQGGVCLALDLEPTPGVPPPADELHNGKDPSCGARADESAPVSFLRFSQYAGDDYGYVVAVVSDAVDRTVLTASGSSVEAGLTEDRRFLVALFPISPRVKGAEVYLRGRSEPHRCTVLGDEDFLDLTCPPISN